MESLINKSNYYFLSFPFICHWKIVLQERFEADTHVSFTSQKDEKERITKAGGWEISRRQREREREEERTKQRKREDLCARESLKSDNGREKEMDVQITRVQTQCVYTEI